MIHKATAAVLVFFEHAHLPEHLAAVSAPFKVLATEMAEKLDGPEVTVGLRWLLMAKDSMVRAAHVRSPRNPNQAPMFDPPTSTDERL